MTRLILALDSATESCSAALLELARGFGGEPLEIAAARSQEVAVVRGGSILLPLIQGLLVEAGARQEDIAAIVVGQGPGTFTGVRVAVATARAMALALQVPIYGLSTLAALVSCALVREGNQGMRGLQAVVPLVDARRGQVFTAVYRRIRGMWRPDGDIFAASPEELVAQVKSMLVRRDIRAEGAGGPGSILLAGAPALLERCADDSGSARHSPMAVEAAGLVRAQSLLKGGFELLSALVQAERETAPLPGPGEPGSPEVVRPIYVRAPDADLHIKKMKDPWR